MTASAKHYCQRRGHISAVYSLIFVLHATQQLTRRNVSASPCTETQNTTGECSTRHRLQGTCYERRPRSTRIGTRAYYYAHHFCPSELLSPSIPTFVSSLLRLLFLMPPLLRLHLSCFTQYKYCNRVMIVFLPILCANQSYVSYLFLCFPSPRNSNEGGYPSTCAQQQTLQFL